MLKMYKDLRISYYFIVFVSAITVFVIAEEYLSPVLLYFLLVLWVLPFAVFFNVAAKKRFVKTLKSALDDCMVEESLNRLYGIYKGRPNNKTDMIIAMNISELLLHLGKNRAARDILLSYNAESVFAAKRFVTHKYLYYHTLAVCSARLGQREEAISAFGRSDELFTSPHINGKIKQMCKNAHEANRLIITGDEKDYEAALWLLNQACEENRNLLDKVSCRYSIAVILTKAGRGDEAKEHIDFIARHGGDTVYRKAALENKLPYEPEDETEEPFVPRPVRPKTAKTYILSVALAVVMLGVAVLYGFLNEKTVYEYYNENTDAYVTETFDKSGNILFYKTEYHDNDYRDEKTDLLYDIYSEYLPLDGYKGCKVSLSRKDGMIDFDLTVDFKKAPEGVYGIVDAHKTEAEFLSVTHGGETQAVRYKEYLFITVFDGTVY